MNLTKCKIIDNISDSKRGGECMIRVTYTKKDGEMIQRTIGGYSPYRIGDVNSYGWKVTDIKYLYEKKWLSGREYDRIMNKRFHKSQMKIKIERKFRELYNHLSHIIVLLVLLRVYELIVYKNV